MPDASQTQLLQLLSVIAQSDAEPWYPAVYARTTGTDRKEFDHLLNELRVAGLVRMTDWQPNVGQGYHVTMEGRRAISRPELISNAPKAKPIVREITVAPRHDVPITRLLVAAQAGAFILGLMQVVEKGGAPNQYLTDGSGSLTESLGVSMAGLQAGAWWTLLTYGLVHAGIPHLGMNLLGLLFDGRLAEQMYGHWRFLVLYMVAIFAGGIGAVLAAPDSLTVGSSGGWCGIVAAEFVWVMANRHHISPAERQQWMTTFARVAILMTAISLVPRVSWGGHLGGAIGGGIAAWLLLQIHSPQREVRRSSWFALILLPIAAGLGLWYYLGR